MLLTLALTPRRWARRLRAALIRSTEAPEAMVSHRAQRMWLSPDGLVQAAPGTQRRHGVVVDQVDSTTCGSTVLVVLRAAADPVYGAALVGGPPQGFSVRLDAAQQRAHHESTRWWPRALGTTPWGMVAWLRRHRVLRSHVRLVDPADAADLRDVVVAVQATTAAGWPVPLLVGGLVPRHWCLALPAVESGDDAGWLVFEPTSGQVRRVPATAVQQRALRPLLGFDDLQAVLLPDHDV